MTARLDSLAWLLPLGLLVGCASTPSVIENPAPSEREVVGSGTTEDRSVINAADQQVYNTEHAESPAPSTAPNQGIP
jgi:hypothetical protein